jgi:hypothetical protein
MKEKIVGNLSPVKTLVAVFIAFDIANEFKERFADFT